ncbi:MAG: hypothetical protein ACI3XL_04830 [Eubacteriales bacterium]
MKRKLTVVACLMAAVMLLTSCEFTIDGILGLVGGTTTTTTTQPPHDDVPPTDEWDELYDIISVAEALEICKGATEPTSEKYYIAGTVTEVSNAQYGEMYIEDATGKIYVYGVKNYSTMEDKPLKSDTVLLLCVLQNYNGTMEVKSAELIDFRKADVGDIDQSDYTEMSISDAREAEKGTKVKVSGVVARITFANGMKPSGVYLVDGTNSIYVYDADLAQRVKIGNAITVLASKTYWVLENEQSSAEKHGYKGCCQLEEATLIANDEKTDNEFDKSWIFETTVKEILNTPVTENVTTTIFKVNALVKKVEGTGFTNYYFFDLDGKTGAYTYTQCNGNDFSWLDEFDGKICTVYLSPLNAKSTSSECYFRFLPVSVIDEGFVFDLADVPEHVIEYYVKDQFLDLYTGDPQAELVTSVSSELLGFEGATVTYSSSNTNVIYFEEVDGKTIFHCGQSESELATVTATVTYGELSATYQIPILVSIAVDVPSIGINEAIGKAVGETVTVKGIIGPSLVNRDGFYLIDESGIIAVIVNDSSVWEGLAVGQEVIIEGKRDLFHDGNGSHAGQTCITGATVIVNNYGKHEYSTDSFVYDKTLADFYALDAGVDYSTTVFVLKATVEVVETNYYTNINLIDGNGTKVSLYCSSANQYGFLKAFAGQEVTVELAPCNWNNKTYWRGCVLSVITDDGQVYNELNFLK